MITDKQKEDLLRLKAQGFTKEQAIARVFTSQTATPQPPKEGSFAGTPQPPKEGSFAGTQDRLAEVGQSTVNTIKQNLAGTGEFADQTPLRRGVQATAAGFMTAPRGAFAMLPSQVREPVEQVGEGISKGFSKVTGAIGGTDLFQGAAGRVETDPNTGVSTYKKNDLGMLEEGLGIFSGLGEIAGSIAATGGTVGTLTTTANFVSKQARRLMPDGTPPPPPPIVQRTPEKLFSEVETDLQRISKDPSLTPAERSAAAEASMTFRERLAGVRPDEKKRIQEMAPGTLERYFDQAHMRNVDDMVDSPYTMGARRADEALEGLDARLRETGGIIGNTRQKLATYRMGVDDVNLVEGALVRELAKLNLSIKNGQIGVTPGKIGKTASNSDISTLQALYNDMLKFKQSPTVANAIDLRMKFDGKINFDKSAREASNSVDPVSKSVRAELAKGAARVVGKTEARELARYSDFMEAYADLKSFTDRAAGGEYLLRLVLSGRGGDAKKLINTVKAYTGIDLMDDALAMKLATDIIGNDSQKNLFRQEVTKAGLDAAKLFSGDARGFTEAVIQKLVDKGVNPEDVYRAIAAGTAGYLLVAYMDEEGLAGAGIAVIGSMSPQARKQALKQADEVAKSTGKTLKLTEEMREETLQALMKSDNMTPASKTDAIGKQTVDIDDFNELDRLKELAEQPKGLTDIEYVEARAILEKYDKVEPASFNQGANPPTTLDPKNFKTAEEYVKAQGKPMYHGGEKIDSVNLNKSRFQKTFYATENPDYAKSYGGRDSVLNEIYLDTSAKLIDLRNPSEEIISVIADKLTGKETGKLIKISRPDGSVLEVPEIKGGASNPVYTNKQILQGITDGKAMFIELPEVKKILKEMGYDGQITTESVMGSNYGVWNANALKTRTQLIDEWKKANE